jgi:ubiquinone/menaquinone biosynthesis C-methylase UbiE
LGGGIVIDSARKMRVQRFYDEFAGSYDGSRYSTESQLRTDRIAKDAFLTLLDGRPLKGRRVLDCGCGTGRFSRLFAELGADVVGIDSSLNMLECARKKVPRARFEPGDILQLSFDREFDVIISSQVLTHLHEYAQPLAGMKRALKEDGVILIDIRNRVSAQNWWAQIKQKLHRSCDGQDYDPDFTTIWKIRKVCGTLRLKVDDWQGSNVRPIYFEGLERLLGMMSPTLFLRISKLSNR